MQHETEVLTPQEAEEAAARVAAILRHTGGGLTSAGQAAGLPAGPAAPSLTPSPSSAPTSATRGLRPKQTRGKRTGTPNQAASSAAADALPSVNISLPKEVHDYFQQQADQDERTLAKYLQRTLREVWRDRLAATTKIAPAAPAALAYDNTPLDANTLSSLP